MYTIKKMAQHTRTTVSQSLPNHVRYSDLLPTHFAAAGSKTF